MKNQDFQNVYKKGNSYGNKYLVMYILNNEENTTNNSNSTCDISFNITKSC